MSGHSPAPRRRLGRRGTSSLEFGLVALPLLILLLAAFELVRYGAVITSLRLITDEAARTASVRGYGNLLRNQPACHTLDTGTSLIAAGASSFLLRPEMLTAVVQSCTTNGAVTTVGVQVRYTHGFLLARVAAFGSTFEETATALFQ